MKHRFFTRRLVIALAALAAACTTTKQEAPDFSGPSEFSTSVVVSISPDVLPQDGASQSVITMTARDANGQPLRNVSLRAEIRVDGTPTDLGSLSARSVVTGSDGRATIVYTAPSSPEIAVDPFTIVEIVVTPLGSDFNNTQSRSASMRLVPTGRVAPPDGLRPAFTFTPSNPSDHQRVLFDASNSEAPVNNPIASYSWSFGDGGTGTGRTATHDYSFPGTYIVTLTITDGFGRSASTSQSLTVGAGVGPTASFTFSPTDPVPGSTVNFNGSSSRPAPGRTIVSYAWDFGDGTSGTGVQTSHRYPVLGNFTVTLVVTDDAGRTGVASQTIPVKFPEEAAVVAPTQKKGGTLRD
jgi:PKD repeat protein